MDETAQPVCVPLPLLRHPCSTEVLPDGQGEPPVFQFVPLVLAQGTTDKSLALSFVYPSLRYLWAWMRSP